MRVSYKFSTIKQFSICFIFLYEIKIRHMKNRIWIILITLIFTSFNLQAQEDNINNYDSQNRKHGTWVKKYQDGQIRYKARFEHGKPVDTTKRYHRNGHLKAVMIYKTPERVYAKLYNPDGKKLAEGYYQNKKKDSVWTFYDKKGRIVAKDGYDNGSRDGSSIRFFRNGDTSHVVQWKNGKRNGKIVQYFENGKEKLIGYYSNGSLKGPLTIFYPNGYKKVEGHYKEDLRDGKWIHYNEQGDTTNVITYIMGTPENENKLERKETQEVLELENNKGKYDDPRKMLYQRNRRRKK
jgi:antitoxin component YwqK of YwqJK toxin-antitoxin module